MSKVSSNHPQKPPDAASEQSAPKLYSSALILPATLQVSFWRSMADIQRVNFRSLMVESQRTDPFQERTNGLDFQLTTKGILCQFLS